jgi:hypothetical protein
MDNIKPGDRVEIGIKEARYKGTLISINNGIVVLMIGNIPYNFYNIDYMRKEEYI